jgi:hypothetical protein
MDSQPKLPGSDPKVEAKKPEEQLAEVERALSVLDGRHPEAVRAQRQDEEAKAKRRAILEEEAKLEARAKLKKRALLGLALALIAASGAMLYRHRVRSLAFEASLDRLTAAYTQLGFAVSASSSLRAPERVEATLEPGCAIATTLGDLTMKIEHGPTVLRGTKTVAWCACAQENVVVSVEGKVGEGEGIRLLHADGKLAGGAAGMRFLEPKLPSITPGADECENEFFDGWLAEKRNPATRFEQSTMDGDPARKRVLASGMQGVSGAPAEMPFAVVDPAPQRCYLALSTVAGDALSLRVPGGAKPIARVKGPIAWCDSREVRFVVQREGAGELAVLATPSKEIGGMLGLRDELTSLGLAPAATWVRPEDVGADAADALRALAAGEPVITHDGMEKGKEAMNPRIVTFSLVEAGSLAVDTPPETFSFCSPSMEEKPLQALCVQSKPQTWRTNDAAPVGVAQAALPAWLSVFEHANDPVLVNAEHALLVLARALRRQHFEPTTLEGVTEQPKGAEVLGRAGEDAVVALTLAPDPPWIFPLTDGEPWKLGGAPRVVPLKPGEKISLTTTPAPSGAKEARRTVVFRRQAR